MQKMSKYKRLNLILIGVTVFLNLVAFSKAFCDFYTDFVYPVLNALIGTLTSWIPFALGEILMYLGIFMCLLLPVILLTFLLFRKRQRVRNFCVQYLKVMLTTVLVVLFVYTINWFIPFRCQILKVSKNDRTEYSLEEIRTLRNEIVGRLNQLAKEVPRDEEGHLIYAYTQEDIFALMREAGDTYPRLKGHYSHLKPALCSDFLDWMAIGGYNYIYTMEPTYNRYCDNLYLPVLFVHELSHHKGYYRENEAEFLSTILLAESENPLFQYAAYREMYDYVNYDYMDALIDSLFGVERSLTREELKYLKEVLKSEPQTSPQVNRDIQYALDEAKAAYEENSNKFLENSFKEASEEVAETGWKVQGDVLGKNSYDGLTLMLLQYYFAE